MTFTVRTHLPRLHLAPARGSDSPRESDSARGFFTPCLHSAPARGADSPRVSDPSITHNPPRQICKQTPARACLENETSNVLWMLHARYSTYRGS